MVAWYSRQVPLSAATCLNLQVYSMCLLPTGHLPKIYTSLNRFAESGPFLVLKLLSIMWCDLPQRCLSFLSVIMPLHHLLVLNTINRSPNRFFLKSRMYLLNTSERLLTTKSVLQLVSKACLAQNLAGIPLSHFQASSLSFFRSFIAMSNLCWL